MTTSRRSMKEILHIIDIAEYFRMITPIYSMSVSVDGDKLIVYTGVRDGGWCGWRNFESPEFEITKDGCISSIHYHMPGYEHGILKLKLGSSNDASHFVPVNRYNWTINFFRDYAEIVKTYIINLADMWAAYNKEANA